MLVPIAVALIVQNGLSPTAALLPAAGLYLGAAAVYRLPVPVQPLKAFGAIAIAQGLGVDEIAAGALLMGVLFLALGASGLVDLAARAFPRPLIRGVQITVGLLFLKIAWGLVADPPSSFHDQLPAAWLLPAAALVLAALALRRSVPVTLVLLAVAAVVMGRSAGVPELGPSALAVPSLDGAVFWAAFTALVLPQLPLTFANSCLATADAARTYFGERAARVRPGRLATTLGLANLASGAVGGMPVCHGAGGLTAHYSFGARTAGAPLAIGSVLLLVAVGLGAGLATLLAAFPLPILAGLLAGAGILHIALARDLAGRAEVALAVGVAAVGFAVNLAVALVLGLAVYWGARALAGSTSRAAGRAGSESA